MYEVVVLRERHDVQRLKLRKACGELREQLVGRRRVDNEDREPSNGRRCPRKNLQGAVSVLREERERDALHGASHNHLRRHQVSPADSPRGVVWHYLAEGVRVHVHRTGYLDVRQRGRLQGEWAQGGREYAAQREVADLGCDSRKAAKSGSNLLGGGRATPTPLFSGHAKKKRKIRKYRATRARLTTEWGSAPDGPRKGSQLEGGFPREYLRERAVSILMDGHLNAQREQTRQKAQHLFGCEQFECKQLPVVGNVDRENLDELAPRRGAICERQKSQRTVLWAGSPAMLRHSTRSAV